MLRGAFKIKKRRNLGKVPNRGGSSKIQKGPKFQLGKVQKERGIITFQKVPKFPKKPKFRGGGVSLHFKKFRS